MKTELIGKIAIVALLAVALLTVPAFAWEIEEDIDLEVGTFSFIPSNNASASYTVDRMTDLGALQAAEDDNILTFNATDYWYDDYGSFYLVDINGVSDDYANNKAWFIYIDNVKTSYGLGLNDVEEDQTIQFRYYEYNTTTWEPITTTKYHEMDLNII
ncbi:DUF4430 domain-containing protein [Methanolobus sp. ZRKC2]|uniref:DUF4430 domain-containing protein n=1 Tax=Methanolobus sp. ZRKC2 TaxID=3125783 RepID=UPI003254911C